MERRSFFQRLAALFGVAIAGKKAKAGWKMKKTNVAVLLPFFEPPDMSEDKLQMSEAKLQVLVPWNDHRIWIAETLGSPFPPSASKRDFHEGIIYGWSFFLRRICCVHYSLCHPLRTIPRV
jgi:hypothetical protein